MFATLKYRRHVAVLAAVAMVASVLVAVPAVAADPRQDYKATYSACVDVPASGFDDVPANHINAGDIDCIAYYGITKGTSATTYSPLMSVSREHMALFLTRLANLVGIEMAMDTMDTGFTDIGDLSEESQTAIAQLKDLGITRGTSDTTYSPADSVTRAHMALFIARLMEKMDPMAEDKDTVFGYIPSKVVDVADGADDDDLPDKTVKSPFTDLGSVTKDTYDAITALWEMGVASGISATAYAPSVSITRAAMASFMTGVLDHSNARPAGVSIQADKTSDFGSYDGVKVAVSYRDDSFMPMVDVSVKIFHSGNDGAVAGVGEFNDDGGCETASACAWTDDESLTDASGNIYVDGGTTDGNKNTYYAWMGDPDADKNDFDVNTSPHASVTLSSTTDATTLKVTSDINENSTTMNTVDLDAKNSVTFTVQLVDDNGAAVAKPGVEITVAWVQMPTGGSAVTVYPAPAPLKTDDDGKATFTITGPKSTKGNSDTGRADTVTFTSDINGNDDVEAEGETSANTVNWSDDDPALSSGKGSAPAYTVLNTADEATVRASVTFYDQYGNTIGKGNTVEITIGSTPAARRTVSSRGVASWRAKVTSLTAGTDFQVTYASIQDSEGTAISSPPTVDPSNVTPVDLAPDDRSVDATILNAVYGDDNRFRIVGLLYTYDSDDIFLDGTGTESKIVDMDKFESLLGVNLTSITTQATVQVVSYDDDGSSIFRVTNAAA